MTLLSQPLIFLTINQAEEILSVYPTYLLKKSHSLKDLIAQPYQQQISEAIVLAIAEQKQISVTAVWSHKITLSGPFSCDILPILSTVTNQDAILNLVITPQHTPHTLATPSPISNNSEEPIDAILENLIYNAKILTGAKEATISLFSTPHEKSQIKLDQAQLDYNQLVIQICYLVAANQKPLRLTAADFKTAAEWIPWRDICVNLLAVPILDSDNQLLGVIQVSNKQKDSFTLQDKDALEQLATLAVVTLSETGISIAQLQTSHLLRTNALLTRLTQISSEFKNFNDLTKLKEYLSAQFKTLNLQFSICLHDPENEGYRIDYISIDSLGWRLIERLLGFRLKNLLLPSDRIPHFEKLHQEQSAFESNGVNLVYHAFPSISHRLLKRVVRIANLHHDTPILNIPLTSSGKNHIGFLSVWGNIQESDISSFVFFTKQLSIAFEDTEAQQTEKDIRLREQIDILDLAQFFLQQPSQDEIFTQLIQTIKTVAAPSLIGAFLQTQIDKSTLSLVKESEWANLKSNYPLTPNSLLASVIINNQPVILTESDKKELWATDPLILDTPAQTHYYLIPFALPKQAVGLLVIGWSRKEIPDRWYRILALIGMNLSQALQQNYLSQQMNRRIQELAGLHEITSAFTNQNNLTQTYDLLTEKLVLLIAAEICFVATYDDENQIVVAQAPGYGLPNEMIHAFEYPLSISANPNQSVYPQLHIINDAQRIPNFFPSLSEKNQLQTMLIAPMYHDAEFVGLILAANKKDGFSEDDAHLMAVFAGQTAVVISNSHLFIKTQRHIDELILISEIANSSLNITDPDYLISKLTQLVSQQFFNEHFGYLLINHDQSVGELLTPHPSFHTSSSDFPTQIPLHQTILYETIKTGIPTLSHLQDEKGAPLIATSQSSLSAPVTVNGIIVGALHAESSSASYFDLADQLFLVTLTRQLSFALEKISFLSILEASEERYRILSELTSDYAYALRVTENNQLQEEWFTGALFRISGYKPEELIQQGGLSTIIYPDDIPSLTERTKILLSGKTDVRELRIIAKSGEIRWLRTYGKPIWDTIEERVKYIYAAAQDITPRIDAQEKTVLRTAELEALSQLSINLRHTTNANEMFPIFIRQAAEIVSAASGCIYMFDETTNELVVRYWYPDLPHMIGLRQSVDHGLTGMVFSSGEMYITEDLSNDSVVAMLSDEEQALKNIQTSISFPLQTQDKIVGVLHIGLAQKHTFVPEEIRILSAISEVAGSALSRAILLETLEERVTQRTSELAEANVRLQELDRMKSQLVSDVSHELRTPIANLKLYVELINRVKSPEKQKHYLSVMSHQMNRLEQLVTDILDMSRLELGKKISFAPTDLNELSEMIISAHRPIAEFNQLDLSFTPDPNLPLIMAEQNQLAQVITNLVANAINYTESGYVRVCTYIENEEYVKLIVEDSGRGIDPLDQPHLFQRFYRGKDSSNENIPGTGLGLAIVKEIIDIHQGTIQFSSTVNVGTNFTILLPVNLIDSPTQL